MHLEYLQLSNFKNYPNLNMGFSKNVNCLVGDNGSGKTNLLDAIYYLSFGRSAFNSIDQQNINHDADVFNVQGKFVINDLFDAVNVSYSRGQRKSILLNKKNVLKTSDLIGKFPVVLIAPNDIYYLLESTEARRKFFDILISQLDRVYLANLINYSKVLRQRNQLLKNAQKVQEIDRDLLSTYDDILLKIGKHICDRRLEFSESFNPFMQTHYQWISSENETIGLRFESSFLQENYREVYHASFHRDLALQRTNIGIHRDDYKLEIDKYALKKYGSQGQQKSFLISMKMAQFDVLRMKNGFKPILLWDDIFDKLDDRRIGKLISMIEKQEFGQLFLTDARPERTRHFMKMLNIDLKIFQVNEGKLKEISM